MHQLLGLKAPFITFNLMKKSLDEIDNECIAFHLELDGQCQTNTMLGYDMACLLVASLLQFLWKKIDMLLFQVLA